MSSALPEKLGSKTSYNQWVNSCSSSRRVSDSESSSLSSCTTDTGGKVSESARMIYPESDEESLSTLKCDIFDKISHDNELENIKIELKKTGKKERKSKCEIVKKYIRDCVFKKHRPPSNSSQDHPAESLSKKRERNSIFSRVEKTSGQESSQKTLHK